MHRKHPLVSSLLASAVLLCSGHALAGTDLSVSGRIQPGACSLALGNGGTVDLGTISRKDLREDSVSFLKTQRISLGIQCQAPTTVAFRALDNRAGTPIYGNAFGLSASGGKNVGGYYLVPVDRIGDGNPLVHLVGKGGAGGWEVVGGTAWLSPTWLSSWAERGQSLPQAFQNISSTLEVVIMIAPTKDLDLSQQVSIDGSATMELIYL
ncbi:DUF1120 domain-containing protein [Burkholderia sp. SCN-KJ]|uniref:DUF1120 domain-containing protein n=1 Tax=Burkholderia sp. SCN-KJ TaxID=2969248 RepID=UPI0021501C25|nr:DUF1120 domain-containing protein [Burkholderia sp. SCN-KJ]MCR4465550.1 DUF1120 domain-containing protein [Burkholderia sp. SCN-KJ]